MHEKFRCDIPTVAEKNYDIIRIRAHFFTRLREIAENSHLSASGGGGFEVKLTYQHTLSLQRFKLISTPRSTRPDFFKTVIQENCH